MKTRWTTPHCFPRLNEALFCLVLTLIWTVLTVSQSQGAPAAGNQDLPQTTLFQEKWGDDQFEVSGFDLTTPELGDLRKGKTLLVFGLEGQTNFIFEEKTTFQVGFHGQHVIAQNAFQVAKLAIPTRLQINAHLLTQNFWVRLLAPEGNLTLESMVPGTKMALQTKTADLKDNALFEDGLFLIVRQLRGQEFSPGMAKTFPLFPSLKRLALGAAKPKYQSITITRATADAFEKIKVPAGEFHVEKWVLQLPENQSLEVWTETTYPHRIVAWRRSNGEHAELLGFKRLPFRKLTKVGDEKLLIDLGL